MSAWRSIARRTPASHSGVDGRGDAANNRFRVAEHVVPRDADDPPSEIGELLVLFDVSLPLARISPVLVPFVLDCDAELGICEVHAADEPPVTIEDVMIRARFRQARIHDHEAHPRLQPRRNSRTYEGQRSAQRGGSTTSTRSHCFLQLWQRAPCSAFDPWHATGNPRDADDRVADRDEVVRMPQHPTRHRPRRGGSVSRRSLVEWLTIFARAGAI
jgi:hypothetical protein